jgi:phospholipid/cholesterol/gamma-HCH transport system permease protein
MAAGPDQSMSATANFRDSEKLTLEVLGDRKICLRLAGSWKFADGIPSVQAIWAGPEFAENISRFTFDTTELRGWDSGILTFLLRLQNECKERRVTVDEAGLPDGIVRLMRLALAVEERAGARREAKRDDFLTRWGKSAIAIGRSSEEFLAFLGTASLAFGNWLRGRARVRLSDVWLVIQETGVEALPIVALVSLLVGLIMAFIGAVQLQLFGAEIYVANLVSLAMAREMGAVMTGVIMSGRTGAAFAAQIGSMQVNQEIDALKTLAISPLEFLVLPRMVALIVMMPLLCIYADIIGIIGGSIVAGMVDISPPQYFNQVQQSITLLDVGLGVIKSAVFGVIIAFSGCWYGIKSGRSASAVGNATTSAVVSAIVVIIVADGIFAVIFNVLGV